MNNLPCDDKINISNSVLKFYDFNLKDETIDLCFDNQITNNNFCERLLVYKATNEENILPFLQTDNNISSNFFNSVTTSCNSDSLSKKLSYDIVYNLSSTNFNVNKPSIIKLKFNLQNSLIKRAYNLKKFCGLSENNIAMKINSLKLDETINISNKVHNNKLTFQGILKQKVDNNYSKL